MTTAVLLATAAADTGEPACTLRCGGEPLLVRLDAQLRRHGVTEAHVLTRPEWQAMLCAVTPRLDVRPVVDPAHSMSMIEQLARNGRGTLLIAHAETVTHESVISGLLADPRVTNGVLSTSHATGRMTLPRLRIERGRVVAAESAYHQVARPTHAFLGLAKVSDQGREMVANVAHDLALLLADGAPTAWEAELSRKLKDWGERFYGARLETGRMQIARAATRILADELEHLERKEAWLPDPNALRAELSREFESEVLRPAEQLREDAVALLVTGLVRRDVVLSSAYLRDLFWDRPSTQQAADAAAEAMEQTDEDRHLLNSAVKAQDGFFTTFFVSPYSKYIARWCARRGFTPNQVTTVSMLLGVLAALAFATGTRAGLVAGAVLLQVAFTTDCVDGQLARYTRQFSKLGAWLDSVFDRAKEYVVYAGLAFGAGVAGADATIWLLAAAALTLQTVRHNIDFSYAAQQHQLLATTVRVPLERPEAVEDDAEPVVVRGVPVLTRLGRAGVRLSVRFESRPWMKWAKRILVLPIGERFALISVTAAFFEPRVTFIALLVWGGVGALYTVTGRILRSFA